MTSSAVQLKTPQPSGSSWERAQEWGVWFLERSQSKLPPHCITISKAGAANLAAILNRAWRIFEAARIASTETPESTLQVRYSPGEKFVPRKQYPKFTPDVLQDDRRRLWVSWLASRCDRSARIGPEGIAELIRLLEVVP